MSVQSGAASSHVGHTLAYWPGSLSGHCRVGVCCVVLCMAHRAFLGLWCGTILGLWCVTVWDDSGTLVCDCALHDSSAPDALQDMFLLRSDVSQRMTRATTMGATMIEPPNFALDTTRRLFSYRAAISWNVQCQNK